VIPWGLDPPPATPPSWDDREIDLLGVGSLTSNKDFSALVEITARLRAEGRRIRTVIVGDGPQHSRIAELIASEGLDDTIRLAGSVERDEVLRSMSRSKILVHPARYESFGFVFSEALAQGMTVVSRPVGIAEPSERWRVADTAAALAEACSSVLDDPPETRSLALFTEDEAADEWVRIYATVAGSR
jgi:glycosyltransferase involved in cell wall biosynthesis